MKIVVLAYHNVGYACLERLLELGADIQAVVTHADNPKENIWFKPVRELAFAHCLPVYQPPDVNDPRMVAAVRRMAPDVIFSFYFRQILKRQLLEIPRIGAFNLHGSLLPRYRGRCPVNWVLVNGEKETGVTLHRMDVRPDRGAIVAQRAVPIDFSDTAFTLFGKLTEAAAELIGEVYPMMLTGEVPEVEQDHSKSSYFGGRKPEDGRIDWKQGAVTIYNLVRAVTHPYPGAFTHLAGRKFYVWWAEPDEGAPTGRARPGEVVSSPRGHGIAVATGKGILTIKRAQWEEDEEIDGDKLESSLGISPGTVLG
ncbi:TPA: formyltransferase [Candidatus Bipolaricaulota bacterium]|nr:formyltransferase [Candidatus Bipolaricaulota bacterium]